jgi:hypothetical protein
MAEQDDNLYSTTIDRSHKGQGWVNIMAHDPMHPDEEENSPAMEPHLHFKTADEASQHAAKSAEQDYDRQRKDPNSQWYMGNGALNSIDK